MDVVQEETATSDTIVPPVVEHGRLVGIVSTSDLLKMLLKMIASVNS